MVCLGSQYFSYRVYHGAVGTQQELTEHPPNILASC